MTVLYAWLCDPHEGEPVQYPMSFIHPELGVMALFSTKRDLMESAHVREIVENHARKNNTTVRLVACHINEVLDIVAGDSHAHPKS